VRALALLPRALLLSLLLLGGLPSFRPTVSFFAMQSCPRNSTIAAQLSKRKPFFFLPTSSFFFFLSLHHFVFFFAGCPFHDKSGPPRIFFSSLVAFGPSPRFESPLTRIRRFFALSPIGGGTLGTARTLVRFFLILSLPVGWFFCGNTQDYLLHPFCSFVVFVFFSHATPPSQIVFLEPSALFREFLCPLVFSSTSLRKVTVPLSRSQRSTQGDRLGVFPFGFRDDRFFSAWPVGFLPLEAPRAPTKLSPVLLRVRFAFLITHMRADLFPPPKPLLRVSNSFL